MTPNQASAASADRGLAAGLVSCKTKDTDHQGPHGTGAMNRPMEIDTKRQRKTRMARAIMKGANLHAAHVAANYATKSATIMATCTYKHGETYNPNDVKNLLKAAREWARRRKFELRYVWTAELTKRGQLHYHVLFFLPPGQKLPLFDRAGWWKKGMTRLEWARYAVAYIAKYASKGGGAGRHKFEKGTRIHGCGGLNTAQRIERRYHLAPGWVRHYFDLEEAPAPAPGGGWYSRKTGDWQESPYIVLGTTAGRVVVGIKHQFAGLLERLNAQKELTPCLN